MGLFNLFLSQETKAIVSMAQAQLNRIEQKLDLVIKQNVTILNKENQEMATVADVRAEVAAIRTVQHSIVVLVQGLIQLVKDARNDPAALQLLIDDLEAGKAEIVQAITEGTEVLTPPAPPPAPAPTPTP